MTESMTSHVCNKLEVVSGYYVTCYVTTSLSLSFEISFVSDKNLQTSPYVFHINITIKNASMQIRYVGCLKENSRDPFGVFRGVS